MKYINLISIDLVFKTLLFKFNVIDQVKYMLSLVGRLDVDYQNLGSKKLNSNEQYIIISNHRSIYDIILVFGLFYKAKIFNISGLSKKKWIYSSILAKGGKPFGEELVQTDDKGFIKKVLKIIKEGSNFIIFPEGTRNRTDAPLLPFQKGVDLLVKQTGKNVLMINYQDTEQIIARGKINPKMKYIILPPIGKDDKNSIEGIYRKQFL